MLTILKLCFLLVLTQEIEGLYNSSQNVVTLTQNNFKPNIINSDRVWLVQFFSSWCGHCRRFAPVWRILAREVEKWNDLVAVGAVDCSVDQNRRLCRDYEANYYPLIRYYHERFPDDVTKIGDEIIKHSSVIKTKKNIINKIIEEQECGRAKKFPILKPFEGKNLVGLRTRKITFLIIQEPDSIIGAEVILDLHRLSTITIRYAYNTNEELMRMFEVSQIPTIFVIGHKPREIKGNYYDKDSVEVAIVDYLHYL